MRAVATAALVGVLWAAGPAPAAADTIGTLDWFECSGGDVTFGDEFIFGDECDSFPSEQFSRFQVTGSNVVAFLSATVIVTIDDIPTELPLSPDPVGVFANTQPGPVGVQMVELLLQVAPGVVTNLTLPKLFRSQIAPGTQAFGTIDADLIVAEPASLTLLATGLLLAGLRRRAAPLIRR